MGGYVLAYDADCGPCTRFRRVVGFLDAGRRISFISLTQADRDGVLDQVPAVMRHRSFHLAIPGGRVLSGAEAIPPLVRVLPAGRVVSRAMATAPGVPRTVRFVYGVFSRLHDSGACTYRPGALVFDMEGRPNPAGGRLDGQTLSQSSASYTHA